MKTKYIKETNKQYSIREDGRVIKHNNNKNIILGYPFKKSYSIRINEKVITLTTSTLLKKYFNYIICNICHNKTYNKIDLDKKKPRMCNNCSKQRRILAVSNWKKKNPIQHKKHQTTQSIRHSITLSDNYIMNVLNVIKIVTPKQLIKAKRQQLILHRTLKQLKNDTNK